MTTLSFHGGVDEIGGNKFLLEDRGSRVFLDFGRNFAREKRYFDEPWISPRREEHLLALGILPNLQGLYVSDEAEPSVDGVLVSHPHADHYDAFRWLKPEIPAYGSLATRAVILSREYAGKAPANEYRIAKLTKTSGREEIRKVRALELNRPQEVAGLPVTAHPVDHSVPGAVGYLVETSEGVVAYTGDFRLHGPRGDQTRAFLEAAAEAEPRALLIEGTHVDTGHVESEEEVFAKVQTVAEGTEGLVVAGFAPADADRMATFHRVAQATDRTLVLTAKQAFLLDGLIQAEEFDAFDLADPHVLIFKKEKRSEYAWEEYLYGRYANRVVEAADVKGMQAEAILVASLMDMLALPVIDPVPGSVYVLSQSEPFDEEMEISYEKLLQWLTHYGLPLFQVHASGHATAHDLRRAVETVAPKEVYLVHTKNAGLFARFLERLDFAVVRPEEGRAYPL